MHGSKQPNRKIKNKSWRYAAMHSIIARSLVPWLPCAFYDLLLPTLRPRFTDVLSFSATPARKKTALT